MEQVKPVGPGASDSCDQVFEASPVAALLRRFFPFYCTLAALVTFGYALYDSYQLDGDAVAYMDIGDNLRAHRWAGIVNGYWHPMYPAFLSLGHGLMRATLATELRAYYFVNFAIFLLEMVAVVCFTDAVVRLRETLNNAAVSESASQRAGHLLDRMAMRYLGLTLLVIASQRELSLGKVRPDALLQAFLLLAMAALLTHLANGRARYAGLMGLALGCAYLTKSFAFVFAFLCVLALVGFRWLWLRERQVRVVAAAAAAAIALTSLAIVAGPYVAALSEQRGRLDFGDSGALNYAWYVGGTEKMHLQPYMTARFGSAEVRLKHPERELLRSPQVLSYAEMPYGTYPDWFDTSYWNDQVKPHFTLSGEIARGGRNWVLVVRYLFNHPEGLVLMALLRALGARLRLGWRREGGDGFWIVPLGLGVAIWGIYGIVNTEERYVTIAYLAIILTLFAVIKTRPDHSLMQLRAICGALVLLLALLSIGESLRVVMELRRQLPEAHRQGWYNAEVFAAAQGLKQLGVKPGDAIACIGYRACMDNQYIARSAGARILTEVYVPETPVPEFLDALPNRDEVLQVVRAQGAKVMIGDFERSRFSSADPALRGWQQLGDTPFYALRLE